MNLSLNLVEHCLISNPIFSNMSFTEIEYFVDRYTKFLRLCKKYSSEMLAPTKDIDEVWHTHMLRPVPYISDCESYFGYVLDHDGYSGKVGEGSKELEKAYLNFERLWVEEYKELAVPLINGSKSCNDLVSLSIKISATSRGAGIKPAVNFSSSNS